MFALCMRLWRKIFKKRAKSTKKKDWYKPVGHMALADGYLVVTPKEPQQNVFDRICEAFSPKEPQQNVFDRMCEASTRWGHTIHAYEIWCSWEMLSFQHLWSSWHSKIVSFFKIWWQNEEWRCWGWGDTFLFHVWIKASVLNMYMTVWYDSQTFVIQRVLLYKSNGKKNLNTLNQSES